MLNEWVKRMCVHYSALMKNEVLLYATARMGLECTKLSEINQMNEDRYCDFTHMWNLKKKDKKQHKCKNKTKK